MWNWSLSALMFPKNRASLVSLLWDDDWVSVGGIGRADHQHATAPEAGAIDAPMFAFGSGRRAARTQGLS
jgi:hypothetical protein